jgi:hypothetical protein
MRTNEVRVDQIAAEAAHLGFSDKDHTHSLVALR